MSAGIGTGKRSTEIEKMRTLILLAFIFTAQSAMAKVLEVQDGRRQYQMTIVPDRIVYKDELTMLTLNKETCNSHLIKRMQSRIDKFFKRPFLEDSRPEFLKVKVDGKQYFEPRYGDRALFLLSVPEEMKKLKIEENLNCGKN